MAWLHMHPVRVQVVSQVADHRKIGCCEGSGTHCRSYSRQQVRNCPPGDYCFGKLSRHSSTSVGRPSIRQRRFDGSGFIGAENIARVRHPGSDEVDAASALRQSKGPTR